MMILKAAIILFLLQFFCFAQGQLDNSFGNGGKVFTNIINSEDYGNAALIQSDGKIIVAGYSYNGPSSNANFTMVRYNSDGTLDNSFGFSGKVTTDFSNSQDIGKSVAIQSDGKIIIAGTEGNQEFALARYKINGTLDSTFGTNGKVTASFSNNGVSGNSVAVQSDGKIVVGGYVYSNLHYNFALIRLNSNGSLDDTFNNSGIDITDFGNYSQINSIVIESDQKILAAGSYYNGGDNDFAVARYNSNGDLDKTFNNTGTKTINVGSSNEEANAIIEVSGGDIILAGYSFNGINNDFAVVSLNYNGFINSAFGASGIAKTDINNSNDDATCIALQKDGKLIVAGTSIKNSNNDFAVVRYNSNGSVDNTFGTGGSTVTDFGNSQDYGSACVIQSDDKIVVAGTSNSSAGTEYAVARYNIDGTLDNTFGSANGTILTDLGNSHDEGNSISIQKDGKIILAGFTNNGASMDAAMVRYNTDGSIDKTFGIGGIVNTNLGSESDAISSVIQQDGEIVLAGYYNNGANSDFAVFRYDSTGKIDNSFGQGGVATADFNNSNDQGHRVALQQDGKILVAGSSSGNFGVARFTTDGKLDDTFGNGGLVTENFGNNSSYAIPVAVQPDGKILVAGSSDNGVTYDFAMIRYDSSGTPDNNFGSNGRVKTDIQNSNDYESSMLLQKDGKIVLVGYSSVMGSNYKLTLVRYNTDGSLDNSFGTSGNGKIITDLGTPYGYTNDATLQPDGKILVLWDAFNNQSTDFLIVRYNTDGTLDNSFGNGGIATIRIDNYHNLNTVGNSIVVQKDGKIVMGGFHDDGYSYDFIAVRYQSQFPAIQLSATSMQFGNVFIDSSLTKSFSITNSGNADLKIDSIISNNNAFTVSPDKAQIQPDSSQNIGVTFKPMQTQDYNGKLIIYHNASGSPDTLALTGSGISNTNLQPAINLSANEINFGTITVNNNISKNLVVKNTGAALLKIDSITIDKSIFAVDTMKFDIPAGDSLILKVTFTPEDTVTYNGILKIYHNANGSPSTVNLSGKGTNQKVAVITFSVNELNFGDVTINNSAQMNFVIGNAGTSDLQVDSIVSSNRIFIADPVNFVIKPDSDRKVTVTFSPVDSINYTGILKIYHNADGNPGTINLTGNGVPSNKAIIKLSSSSLAFGNVIINTSKALTLNIQNTGKVNLNIDSIRSSSSNFVVNGSGFIVKPDSIKDVSVVFTPTDSVAYSGFLNIYHNATGNISTVSLNGEGIKVPKAIISISTEALSFGDLIEGSNVTLNFNIKNNGLADLVVDSIKSNINVFTVSPTNLIIKPDSDKNISVTFSPQDSIIYNGKISIYTSVLGNPAVINVSGSGFVYPNILSANQAISFGDVANINNYKIIGIPGNSNIAVSSLTQGDYQYAWNVYDDNGNAQDYLTTSSSFKFSAGKAYWLISSSTININQQITPVQLNSDYTYSIPLHTSWNLISDPFEKNITWQNVQNLNGLPANSILYYWNGSNFSNPSSMIPYQGYYFNNTSNLTNLKLRYEPHQGSGKISKVNSSAIDTKNFLELSANDKEINQTSAVFFGIDSLSKQGIDNYDYFAPPADFQKVRISIVKNELPAREKYLFIEQRPAIKDGQEFELEIKAVPGEPINLAIYGIGNFTKYNIYLLDERLQNLYNLRENRTIKLNLAHQFNNFRLIIGTDEYLNQIKKQLAPAGYQLYQNYPNPFNPTTVIRFSIPKQESITLKVYNILGQLVRTLIENQIYEAGYHEIEFNGRNLASGVYIVRLESNNFTSQKKMVMIK